MSVRTYEKKEKQAYVEDFKNSGETIGKYALEKGIPETTLRGWLKEDKDLTFGAIEIKPSNIPFVNGKIICRKMAKKNVVFPTYFLCHKYVI